MKGKRLELVKATAILIPLHVQVSPPPTAFH